MNKNKKELKPKLVSENKEMKADKKVSVSPFKNQEQKPVDTNLSATQKEQQRNQQQ
ncbi:MULTISPECIES: hypothetical protein [unclassified Polaribacter]|uniref:hypothetical protein n=1 Tax=unclassified Polaribacter TaxID=196858 RepID=UPI00167942D2|nr:MULTISPECIES: hypothetical protein [unclassified Polaribacter]